MKPRYYSILVVLVALLFLGCAGPQERAQKLFEQGKYEQVVTRYGTDSTSMVIVRSAKAILGARLLAEKKYAQILELVSKTLG